MSAYIRPTTLPIDPWPTPDRGYATCRITSPYGLRDGVFHAANDIGNGRLGDEIIAARSGKVILASNQPSPPWNYAAPAAEVPYWGPSYGGNVTVIDHGAGEYSQYAHQRDMLVKAGDLVVRGQLIGHIGDSGSAAPPPHGGGGHLHFGIRFLSAIHNDHNGWIDPWPLIAESAAVAPGDLLSIPDTATEGEPMPTILRPLPNSNAVLPPESTVYDAPGFGATHNGTGSVERTIFAFAVVEGDAYKTGATTTSKEWLALINNDTFRYIPAINAKVVKAVADCSAQEAAAAAATKRATAIQDVALTALTRIGVVAKSDADTIRGM